MQANFVKTSLNRGMKGKRLSCNEKNNVKEHRFKISLGKIGMNVRCEVTPSSSPKALTHGTPSVSTLLKLGSIISQPKQFPLQNQNLNPNGQQKQNFFELFAVQLNQPISGASTRRKSNNFYCAPKQERLLSPQVKYRSKNIGRAILSLSPSPSRDSIS